MPTTRKRNTLKSGAKKTATRRAPARGKTARKPQPKRNTKPVQKKENGTPIIYIALAMVIVGFMFAGTSSEAKGVTKLINSLLYGLAGGACFMLPVTLSWMGIRKIRGEEKQGRRGTDEFLPVSVLMCVLTVCETFAYDRVASQMQVDGFVNFVKYAYKTQIGGGALGAIIGYPAHFISAGLTCFIAVVILLVMFNIRGYYTIEGIGAFFGKTTKAVKDTAGKTIAEARKSRKEAKERRLESWEIATDSQPDDVEIPDLGDGTGDYVYSELKGAGRTMRVPKAGEPKKTATYKGEKSVSRSSGVYEERIFSPKPETPAAKKPVPAKPVFEKPVAKPVPPKKPDPKPDVYDFEEEDIDIANMPDYSELQPVKPVKEPQQPKPSFFDDSMPKGPVIRQNTDQGKTADEYRSDVKRGTSIEKIDSYNKNIHKEYVFPSFDLMEGGSEEQVADSSRSDRKRGEDLVSILGYFNIPVKLVGISHGPAVTRLEILPDPGVKVSRIAQYSDDIQMGLEVKSVRIEAPIPGKRAVGVEIPNPQREIVHLRDILESPEVKNSKKKLLVALGKDNGGKYITADLASMPHVLIAGQTGSGKSICINAIIISLLYRCTPEEVRLIMVDPKMVELNVYNSIPHLLVPVVTDPQKAAGALDWAVVEMSRRYKVFKERGTKNIESYNMHLEEGEKPMPRIVIIIDELADLMMTAKHDVEESINRLAQLARAAGMHLVIATQRPSVNVITGLIKANIPTRIAFTVASGVDSNTILDSYGAEKLLGKGDMLYSASDSNKPMRMQGAWVSEDEVQRVVDHIAEQQAAEFDEDIIDHLENTALPDAEKKDKLDKEAAEETDPLLEEALRAVIEANQASISMLQRKLKVGYPRAGKLIDMMEQRGFVSKGEGSKARDVLVTREQLDSIFGSKNGEDMYED